MTAPAPYYQDDLVTLYHGDCRVIGAWLTADALVTDPPYGRDWRQGALRRSGSDAHHGITGDVDTTIRDTALQLWTAAQPAGVALMFGDLMLAPPPGTKQVLVFRKPPNAGTRGATGGRRRDAEAVYMIGPWTTGLGGRSSIIATGARTQGNPHSAQGKFRHPHAKPQDVMEELIGMCPPGATIADPFAGSGSGLVAAKSLGHPAIGVESEESHCRTAAARLRQDTLFAGSGAR